MPGSTVNEGRNALWAELLRLYPGTVFSYIIIVMVMNLFPPTLFDVSGTGFFSFGVAKYTSHPSQQYRF